MVKLQQYKEFFLEDNGQGVVRILDKACNHVRSFDNILSAKMWIEIQTDDQYVELRYYQ